MVDVAAVGLTGASLFGAVVAAALPTAQNVITHAVRHDRGVSPVRDAVSVSTFGSIAVVLGVDAPFHGIGWA